MHSVVFKLALAAILAAAVFFLLAHTFSELEQSSSMTDSNIESARRISLNKSAAYLQQ